MTTPDITATRRDASTRSGLYGSDIGRNMAAAAVAETLGTFILIYGGTAGRRDGGTAGRRDGGTAGRRSR